MRNFTRVGRDIEDSERLCSESVRRVELRYLCWHRIESFFISSSYCELLTSQVIESGNSACLLKN